MPLRIGFGEIAVILIILAILALFSFVICLAIRALRKQIAPDRG